MENEIIEFRVNRLINSTFNTKKAALEKIKEKTPGIEEWKEVGIYHDSNPFAPIGFSGEIFTLTIELIKDAGARFKVLDAFISKEETTEQVESTRSIKVPIVKHLGGKYSVYNTEFEVCKPSLEPHAYNDKDMKNRSFQVLFPGSPPRTYPLQSRVLAGDDKRDEVAMMAAHDLIYDRLFLDRAKDLKLHDYLRAIEQEYGLFGGSKELILKVEALEGLRKSYLPRELYDEDGMFKLDFDEVSEDGSTEAYNSLYKIETLPNS